MRRLLAPVSMLSVAACATVVRAPSPEEAPRNILARAIEQMGGAEALTQARAVEWEGVAVVHAGGRDARITGRWQVQPPDSAVVATYEASQGPSTERSLVLAAPRGWLVSGARFTPMPPAMVASERAEFYLYELIRLVSLRDSAVTLAAAPPDSVGQAGIRADRPGRPTAFLYVDECGRLSHVRLQVPSAESGQPEWQDAWFRGVIEAEGVRWPRALSLLVEGKPYFDLLVQSLRVMPRLDSGLLTGPG